MSVNKFFTKLAVSLLFVLPALANATIITIDNGEDGFSSSGFKNSTASCCVGSAFGPNYMVDTVNSAGDYAKWDPTGYSNWFEGLWKVEINWTSYSNRADNALVSILTSSGLVTQTINQTSNGGVWHYLGTFNFSQLNAFLKLDDTNSTLGQYVIADAVRFTAVPAPSSLGLLLVSGLVMLRLRRK